MDIKYFGKGKVFNSLEEMATYFDSSTEDMIRMVSCHSYTDYKFYNIDIKEITGFPGYFIDKSGAIYSNKSNKWLKPNHNNGTNTTIVLYNEGKRHNLEVKRLVAEAFIPKTKEDIIKGRNTVINKYGNKLDCYYSNLLWVNDEEVMTYSFIK